MAFVEKIELRNFRNFKTLKLNFSAGVNIFIGQNGQGKTNLIEAIYLMSHGRSFRYANNENYIFQDDNETSLNLKEAVLNIAYSQYNLKNKIKLNVSEKRKIYELNDKKTNALQIQNQFINVLFSPESLSAIKGGSEQRRLLIDETLGLKSKANKILLNEYKKSLKVRNKILKDFRNNNISLSEFKSTLQAINELFLNLAVDLTMERLLIIDEILPKFIESIIFILNLKNTEISIDYWISQKSIKTRNRSFIFDELKAQIQRLSEAERALGSSLVGPHRHEIHFLYNNKNARTFCSQGQQRSLILAFKIAQIIYYHNFYEDYPIILLDDVFSELDDIRRINLIDFLKKIDSQIFITTTDITSSNMFCDKDLKIFKVTHGQINPA